MYNKDMAGLRSKLPWVIIGVQVILLGGVVAAIVLRPDKAAAPTPAIQAQNQSSGYKAPVITPVAFAKGLSAPTAIASSGLEGDTQLFIAERAGRVRSIDTSGKVSEPVLDISQDVLASGEMGLLGLAFDPKFATNNYFYVFYINKQKKTVVARYALGTETSRPGPPKVLLTLQQEYGNHKGGELQFGPDGYLYVGIGDGGGSGDPHNRGQDKNTFFGKILRIDVSKGDPYSVPDTNPFVKTTAAKPEIWAYGLRNPWRFSFDRASGDMYLADVGQNAYEEINFQPAGSKGGQNYGWRCYEGNHDFNKKDCKDKDQYVSPAIEYDHSNNRCSVTGGFVYRGDREPSLDGKYIYGDFCSGELFYAEKHQDTWKQTVAASTDHAISTFGQDVKGELYYADLNTGTIYRITDAAN